MALAYIALGSNLGDRSEMLSRAVDRLARFGRVVAVSSHYETEPVGYHEQPPFLNAVLGLETSLEPVALLEGLLAIEREMGRDRSGGIRFGPRIVDLDLLLLGDAVVETERLVLPHPALAERRFVLEPLAEIASGVVDPRSGKTVGELLAGLRDDGENRRSAVRRVGGRE
jgi:2-amino-4-hydroxy-6-hydroxymethyldihydropteridine diphosphokinase